MTGREIGTVVSARLGASIGQKWCGFGFLLVLTCAVIVSGSLQIPALLAAPVFLGQMLVNLGAAFEPVALPSRGEPLLNSTGQDFSAQNANWPRFTILAPMYDEARIVPQFVAAMQALDYPAISLEVLILLEPDDDRTISAFQALKLPDFIRPMIVPAGLPRTKPRALNVGLEMASGTFVTVYDAEDLPEPDQLKRAVAAFQGAPDDVACFQARLAIDNGPDGWLALMCCVEYAALFDTLKCGFCAMRIPIPLGGTSNHFRTDVLRQLGGWDAWNVTEDADLGLRIARAGMQVQDLPSTTYEEAPFHLTAWMGQRRRWLKGWMQTGICHSRQPWLVIREMGLSSWLFAMTQIAGVVVGALTLPFFTALAAYNAWHGTLFDGSSFMLIAINSVSLVVLAGGYAIAFGVCALGLKRRRLWQLTPWLITLPIYMLLISVAAWLALADYLRRPFHWQKTSHGEGNRRNMIVRSKR